MQLAVSQLALPGLNYPGILPALADMGFAGIELVPAQLLPMLGVKPTTSAVSALRHRIEEAGLQVVGLHGVLQDRPELGIFGDAASQTRTADYLVELSAICRDLGGRTLTIAGGRWRRELPKERAWWAAHAFLEHLLPRIEAHGTLLCLEPCGAASADFCNSAADCRILANAVDHPSLGLQLNAHGLLENNEFGHSVFAALYGRLEHFAVNEPALAPLGSSGRIDHAALRRHLAAGSYAGWISIQQQAAPGLMAIDHLRQSLNFFNDCYCRPGAR